MLDNIKSSRRAQSVASLGLALIGIAALPGAALAHGDHAAPAASSTAAVASVDNMTVVRDAETGQLRMPTAAESAAMQLKAAKALKTRAAVTPNVERWHSSGARGAILSDEFMSHSVVTRQPDGSLVKQCFDSQEAADAAVKAASASAKPAAKLATE